MEANSAKTASWKSITGEPSQGWSTVGCPVVVSFQRVPGISNPHLQQSTRVAGTKLKRVHQGLAEAVEPWGFWPWLKKDKVW